MRRLIPYFCVTVWSCFALAQSTSVGLSPVPLYPPDGQISADLKDQFVFLDTKTWDLVLAYPPIGPLGNTPSGETRTLHSLELARHALPLVAATVSKAPSGAYIYSYTVTNGSTARQAIQRWFLSIPAPEAPDPTKLSANVAAAMLGSGWNGSYFSFAPGRWAVRWDPQAENLLHPNERGSFTVQDKHKPGIVETFFQGAVSNARVPDDLPEAASKQLALAQQLAFNSSFLLTIGPKFDASTPKVVVAADFNLYISRLAHSGALNVGSPFVKTTLDQLRQFIESPRPEGMAPSANEPFPVLQQKPDPNSPLEQQVYAAMQLALDF